MEHIYTGADPEGGFGDLSPLNILEVKIIKNVKKILKLMGNIRLALKFSQEIRRETRISNFNLKGDLLGKIWGDFSVQSIFRFIYLINLIGQKYRIYHLHCFHRVILLL